MTLPVDDWDFALFDELQKLLIRITNQATTSSLRQLKESLEDAEPWLAQLTALPGPSDESLNSLNNPITLPSGTVVHVAGELLETVKAVSNHLNISQRLAAILLVTAEAEQSSWPSRTVVEISTYLLYGWQAQMLDFFIEVLAMAIGRDQLVGTVFDPIRDKIAGLLERKVKVGNGEGTFVDLILNQLDDLQSRLDQLVRTQRVVGPEYDLLVFRIESLRASQNRLIRILSFMAFGGVIGRGQVVKLLKWLKKTDKVDGLVMGVFSVFLAATPPFKSIPDDDPRSYAVEEWCQDVRFLKVASNLVLVENWSSPKLKEAAKLSWMLFVRAATGRDAPAVNQLGLDPTATDAHIDSAVQAEAFQFLRDQLSILRQERGLEPNTQDPIDVLVTLASVTADYNDDLIFGQLQEVTYQLIGKKDWLRKLKSREEDVPSRRAQVPVQPQRNFTSFLSLLATLYKSLPPDSAIDLWNDSTFAGTVLDYRGWPSQIAWDMLQAISVGPQCANQAYARFRDSSKLSWSELFRYYKHFHDILPHAVQLSKTTRQVSTDPLQLDDVILGVGWSNVLSTVVKWSPVAKSSLLQLKPHPIQLMFDFLNCEVPSEMRASVLNAITAFCTRTGDAGDADLIAKAVEQYIRITFSSTAAIDSKLPRLPMSEGWVRQMEDMDRDTYPLTRAYVRFLTVLLPSDGRPQITGILRRATRYIIETMLLGGNNRAFARAHEELEFYDEVFAFLEKALFSFNITEKLLSTSNSTVGPIAAGLYEEPGFVVILEILNNEKVFQALADTVDRQPKSTDILLRALRLYHRVLEVQLAFSDVLLLALIDHTRNTTNPFRLPHHLQSLDQRLLGRLSNVNTISLLVNSDNLPASLVSTRIIVLLATSPAFNQTDRFRGEYSRSVNRLAGFLAASDDSILTIQGFCNQLDKDGLDVSPEELERAQNNVLKGEIRSSDLEALPLVIRSTILDLLIDGTSAEAAGPNIAHFLLGFEFKGHDVTLQQSSACLRVILRQLMDKEFVMVHPVLAAKSARLIHQLFSHPTTGQSAMTYATSVQGYSASQLANLPRKCPSVDLPGDDTTVGELGVVAGHDETVTTAYKFLAYLEFQRWIVSCASLETHAHEGRGSSASSIANALFDGTADRPPLITDLLTNVDLSWLERTENDSEQTIEFFASFNFDAFKPQADVDWWNLKDLERTLHDQRKESERKGAITGQSAINATAEIAFLVKQLGVLNRRTEVNFAKGNFLNAWSELLKVALGRLFIRHVSEDRQDVVLFDLLDSMLDRINGTIGGGSGSLSHGVLDIFAESSLVTMSTLTLILSEYEGINLPVDRLNSVLMKIIDAITRPGTTENSRGNLYACITQYLSLLSTTGGVPDENGSVVASTVRQGQERPDSAFQKATMTTLSNRKERFIPMLCRDVMDLRDIWKTECYTLLSAIISVCVSDKDRNVLSPLLKNGYLPVLVRSIKDTEIALQECLMPESENLHAFWVFEAKIAFLLTVATTRKGAEDLLDAGIFEILSMCGFISSVQPLSVISSIDQLDNNTTQVFECLQRQHRVLIYSLQLLVRILTSLHKSGRTGSGHAISFLNAHRDSILLFLREVQQTQTVTTWAVEEIKLLIGILALVVHKVPEDDQKSTTGFGAFHLSVLSIAAKFFDPSWADSLDQNEAVILDKSVLGLNQVILGYLCAATAGLKSGSGYPVFVNGSHRSNGGAKYVATAPSLQLAVDFVGDLTERAQELNSEFETLMDDVADGGDLTEDRIKRLHHSDLLDEVYPTAESVRTLYSVRSQGIHNMSESLLLLLWRHLLFYANDARNGDAVRPNNLSLSLASGSQFEASRSGVGAMRALERVSADLRGVLERVAESNTPSELKRHGGKNDAYFGMLVRRLRELTAGLSGQGPQGGQAGMDQDQDI